MHLASLWNPPCKFTGMQHAEFSGILKVLGLEVVYKMGFSNELVVESYFGVNFLDSIANR